MLLKSNSRIERLKQLPWGQIGRWWVVGLAFCFVGLAVLYLFVDRLKLPLALSTLAAAEATTIVRYGLNDLWVFEERHPSWKRFWQFHVANAGGFVVWWAAVNVLPHLGLHYLLASLAGTGGSVSLSMATNFLWIWRKKALAPESAAVVNAGSEVADAG